MALTDPFNCCEFIEFASDVRGIRKYMLDVEFFSAEEIQLKFNDFKKQVGKSFSFNMTVLEKDESRACHLNHSVVFLECTPSNKSSICTDDESSWISFNEIYFRKYFNPTNPLPVDVPKIAEMLFPIIQDEIFKDGQQAVYLQCFIQDNNDGSYINADFGFYLVVDNLTTITEIEVWLTCCFNECVSDISLLRVGLKFEKNMDKCLDFQKIRNAKTHLYKAQSSENGILTMYLIMLGDSPILSELLEAANGGHTAIIRTIRNLQHIDIDIVSNIIYFLHSRNASINKK